MTDREAIQRVRAWMNDALDMENEADAWTRKAMERVLGMAELWRGVREKIDEVHGREG